MIEFELPWMFTSLPLAFLCYWLLPSAKLSHSSLLKVPFFNELKTFEVRGNSVARSKSYILLLLSSIWLLLVIASARPVWLGEEIILPAEGRDLMLAVDVSGSMRQNDMKIQNELVDRLSIVKLVLKDFIARRTGDRMGLILFGSNAYLQTPLTFDQSTLTQFLLESEIGIAGDKTAIGDAIGLAIKRLHDRPADSRVLILLTDGSNTAGAVEPLQAAKLAKEKDLKIYTVGIGADHAESPGLFGSSFFSQSYNPSADLDESTLKEIAELTGGQYFRAKDTQSLVRIYTMLDQLEAIEADHLSFRPKHALFHWCLGFAFLLSFIYTLGFLSKNFIQNQMQHSQNHRWQKTNQNNIHQTEAEK